MPKPSDWDEYQHVTGYWFLDAQPNWQPPEDVPHAWLSPRLAAVVHHGGAGATAAGLRASVPGIILPFGGDQRAWADLLVKLGVGLQGTTWRSITAAKLAQVIQTAVKDSTLRDRVAALGKKIRAEDGLPMP